jgi:hypothetical protein
LGKRARGIFVLSVLFFLLLSPALAEISNDLATYQYCAANGWDKTEECRKIYDESIKSAQGPAGFLRSQGGLISFFLTATVELCVAFAFGLRNGKGLIAVLAVNVFTQPALTALFGAISTGSLPIPPGTGLLAILALELLVILAEFSVLNLLLKPDKDEGGRLFLLSFVMNVASFIAGTGILLLLLGLR